MPVYSLALSLLPACVANLATALWLFILLLMVVGWFQLSLSGLYILVYLKSKWSNKQHFFSLLLVHTDSARWDFKIFLCSCWIHVHHCWRGGCKINKSMLQINYWAALGVEKSSLHMWEALAPWFLECSRAISTDSSILVKMSPPPFFFFMGHNFYITPHLLCFLLSFLLSA